MKTLAENPTTHDPQDFIRKQFRYYCGDDICAWRHPVIAKEIYPHHIDCTDMTDEEFIEFLHSEKAKAKAV